MEGNLKTQKVLLRGGEVTDERFGHVVAVLDSWPNGTGSEDYWVMLLLQIP
jgi:hypothetical protein